MGTASVKGSENIHKNHLSKIQINIDVNKSIRAELGQMLYWSLAQIRKVYQSYRTYTKQPFLDAYLFSKIMPFSKTTNYFLFQTFNLKKKYLCIFELICALVLTAYTNYTNKLHFLYLLFDFDCSFGISLFQLMFIYKSIIMAYCKLSKCPLPNYHNLETYTKIMFLNADTSQQKQVTLKEMIQTVEGNEKARTLFDRFQPQQYFDQIKENYQVFLPFKPYDQTMMLETFQKINKAYLENNFDSAKQQNKKRVERLQKSKSIELKKLQTKIDVGSTQQKLLNIFLSVNHGGNKKYDSTSTKNISSFQKLPPLTKKNISNYNNLEAKLNTNIKQEILKRMKQKKPKKLVFIGGETLSKQQIFTLYDYFVNLANNNHILRPKQFFQSFENHPCIKKLVANLYNFLDQNQKGTIEFQQFIKKLYPRIDKQGMLLISKWINQYRSIYDIDYMTKLREVDISAQKLKVLPASSMKRLNQIFKALDLNEKGYLTLEDFQIHFKYGFTSQQITKMYARLDVKNQNKIFINQLAKLLLPPTFVIEGLQ